MARHERRVVPLEPPFPELRDHLGRGDVVGKPDRAVVLGGVGSGEAPLEQDVQVVRMRERRRAGAQLVEEALDRAVVAVPQAPSGDAEERSDRDLEQPAAGVTGEALEEIGPEHRRHRRSLAAARLAGDTAIAVGLVALVDERDDLVADVRVVAAAAGRVDELRAADRRPGVDEDNAGVDVGVVEQLEEGRPEGGPVAPHLDLAGEALEDVDRRPACVGRRRVDPERPLVRVAERIPAQRLARDHMLVECASHPAVIIAAPTRAPATPARCDGAIRSCRTTAASATVTMG